MTKKLHARHHAGRLPLRADQFHDQNAWGKWESPGDSRFRGILGQCRDWQGQSKGE